MREEGDRPIGRTNAVVASARRSVPWIWEGLVAEGAVTLLSAPEKVSPPSQGASGAPGRRVLRPTAARSHTGRVYETGRLSRRAGHRPARWGSFPAARRKRMCRHKRHGIQALGQIVSAPLGDPS
jgi:hypothetical protein